jgi:hypothetical protein
MTVTDQMAPAVHPCCIDGHKPGYVDNLLTEFLAATEAGNTAEADRLDALVTRLCAEPPRLADAALVYASWGWPVFPLQPGGKAPLTAHGFKDASTDPAQVRAWWKQHPRANIGLPTGVAFDVVDVDAPAGWPAWRELCESPQLPEVHGLAHTSGGGVHAYICPTGGGNLAGFRPGIDFRGKGGYVVAPPSVRGGGRWSWIVKPSPVLTGLEPASAA